MDSGDLNEFFQQILHTERSLSSRNTKLRELKEEILSCVQAVGEVQRELKTQEGELAVRNVKMVDEEVEARLLRMRESILEGQKRQLLEENQKIASQLETARSKLESEREVFLDELREFGRSYDLVGAGAKHREQLTQKKVSTLQDEVLLLEAELAEFECEKEEVRKLEEKLKEMEHTLAQKQDEKRVLKSEVCECEAEIRQLQEECESLSSKPSTDPEILKLQKELEECKDCPEEKKYHSLHKELEELQRLAYHKQMRQHMSRRTKTRQEGMGNYNPYVHQYEGRSGRRECENGGGVSGVRGSRVEGESGETEDGDEGWDDELEAAELASFQESLSISEMEWAAAEEDDDDFEVAPSRPLEGDKDSAESGQPQKSNKRAPHTTLPTSSGGGGGRITKQERVLPAGQQSGSARAVRAVVKRSGELMTRHLAQVTDSPATLPVRRPSGQSIYKAPGQHDTQPQHGVPKTAKRVRFRY